MPRRRSILCACILCPPLRKGVYKPFLSEKIVHIRLTPIVLCRGRQGRISVVPTLLPWFYTWTILRQEHCGILRNSLSTTKCACKPLAMVFPYRPPGQHCPY